MSARYRSLLIDESEQQRSLSCRDYLYMCWMDLSEYWSENVTYENIQIRVLYFLDQFSISISVSEIIFSFMLPIF
jgi:hypothetical protein